MKHREKVVWCFRCDSRTLEALITYIESQYSLAWPRGDWSQNEAKRTHSGQRSSLLHVAHGKTEKMNGREVVNREHIQTENGHETVREMHEERRLKD